MQLGFIFSCFENGNLDTSLHFVAVAKTTDPFTLLFIYLFYYRLLVLPFSTLPIDSGISN